MRLEKTRNNRLGPRTELWGSEVLQSISVTRRPLSAGVNVMSRLFVHPLARVMDRTSSCSSRGISNVSTLYPLASCIFFFLPPIFKSFKLYIQPTAEWISLHNQPRFWNACWATQHVFSKCVLSNTARLIDFHFFLGALAKWRNCERRLLVSSCPSVRLSARNNSAPIGLIFIKFYILWFFEIMPRKIQVSLKSDNNNEHFTWTHIHINDNIWLNSSYSQ